MNNTNEGISNGMKRKFLQLFIFTAITTAFFGVSGRAHAAITDNVSGWGWSSTIGWISLNSADDHNPNAAGVQADSTSYGVRVDTTQGPSAGAMSGYAWSPNIGWVSFNSGDVVICPSGTPARINLTTGAVTGFARATAAGNASSGWDGCISLSGSNYGLSMNPTSGALSGYAWGSTVIGWVSVDGLVQLTPNLLPVLTLTASPPQLQGSGPSTLTWTSANVQTASCSSSWAGAVADNGTQIVQVAQTTTYTITCMGTNSLPITATATVTVVSQTSSLILQANPMSVQSTNATTVLSWTSPNQTNFSSCTTSASPATSTWTGALRMVEVPSLANGYTHTRSNVVVPSQPNQSTTYTLVCTGSSTVSNTQVTATAVVSVFPPTPAVTLAATPTTLPQTGGSADLVWTAANVNTCNASANPTGWSGQKSISGGTETIPTITTTTMFTLTCPSSYSPPSVTASATVYVAGSPLCSTCTPQAPPKPKFEEF